MYKVEKFVENYFDKYKIPKILHNGESSIKLAVYGCTKVNLTSYYTMEFTKQWLPEKPKYIRIYTYILSIYDKKYCPNCHNIKSRNDFHRNKARKDNVGSICKICDNLRIGQKSAFKRAEFINRTPEWANLDLIEFFYECCPKNCHVDHIIPLRGKNISGLHIETNLQWLPINKNIKKSNKWPGELG